jgi:hypothetical protein
MFARDRLWCAQVASLGYAEEVVRIRSVAAYCARLCTALDFLQEIALAGVVFL